MEISEEFVLEAIQARPSMIHLLVRQGPISDHLLIQMIRKNIRLLRFIKDPAEAVQLEAVKHGFSDAITYIKRPTEAVRMAAVTSNAWAINYIKNPSEAEQNAAILQNPTITKRCPHKFTEEQINLGNLLSAGA